MRKKQVILGLGKTGLSCVRYLAPHDNNLIVCDTRENPPGLAVLKKEFPEIPVRCGPLSAELLCSAARIIVSPGLPLRDPALRAAIEKDIPVIGDIELFVEKATAPIIAITGTNAKGTVATLTWMMAKNAGLNAALGGNIGIPVLDLLQEIAIELYILELSSFQLESTYSLQSVAATILNVSEDHLDHHADMNEYIAAKQRIYFNADNVIVNRADPATFAQKKAAKNVWSFGLDIPNNEREFGLREKDGVKWLSQGESLLLPITELKIVGLHNVENALAALALGVSIHLPLDAMLKTLKEFTGLPHRCQLVRELNGVRWYNDSKATNIGSVIAALNGFANDQHNKLILIAGGDGKGANFNLMRDLIRNQVEHAILFGKDADTLASSWQDVVYITRVQNLSEAVNAAAKIAQAGDLVLLSPACSSLDMFKNFEERGNIFSKLVIGLS